MTLKEYKDLAMRTNDGKCTERLKNNVLNTDFDLGGLLNACLGLSGEVGEFNDMIKKAIFHGHAVSRDYVIKELGDIFWYLAMACDSLDIDMDDVAKTNIEKLVNRYPEGFSEYASQHRKEDDI